MNKMSVHPNISKPQQPYTRCETHKRIPPHTPLGDSKKKHSKDKQKKTTKQTNKHKTKQTQTYQLTTD